MRPPPDGVPTCAAMPAVAGSMAGGCAVRSDRAMSDRAIRLVFVDRHGKKLQPVPDESIAELRRDRPLQLLDVLVVKFDDAAGLHVDQVIVVIGRHLLV